jgi:hypothetical protein
MCGSVHLCGCVVVCAREGVRGCMAMKCEGVGGRLGVAGKCSGMYVRARACLDRSALFLLSGIEQ